ncbi:sialate O-acetylesterase [bacterium]|nr:sialate O-acetylesterase [bacterium]
MPRRFLTGSISIAVMVATMAASREADGGTHVRVLLMAGQSNMGGTGNSGDLFPGMANQTNVWFDNAVPGGSATTNWTALGSGGGFGPEVGCGFVVANALPDEQIAVVKDSAAATGIDFWRKPGEAGFISLTSRIDIARQRLEAQKLAGEIDSYRYAGFFWMQGENEANAGVPSPGLGYFTALTDLVNQVRIATGVPDLPAVIGQTSSNIIINNVRDLNNVRSNQAAFVSHDPHAALVNIDDVGMQDSLHLNSPGSLSLGIRMGTAHLLFTEPNPCVNIDQTTDQSDPTDDRVVRFTAAFSKPVTDFDAEDVILEGSAGASTALVWRTSAYNGSNETYTIAVAGMTNNGSVIARMAPGVVASGSHSNFPSVSEDNTVWFGIEPSVTNLLAQDDCNRPNQSLNRSRAGFGWRNYGWDVQNGRKDGYVITNAAPLAYSNLMVNAPYASGGDTYVSAGREVDFWTALKPYHAPGDNANIGRPNDEFWLSYLVRRDQNQQSRFTLCRGGTTWAGSPEVVSIQQNGGNWVLSLMGDANYLVDTGVPATLGRTFLMVLRLRFAGTSPSNIVDLYVDPAQLGAEPPASPTVSVSIVTNLFRFSRMHWYPGSQPNHGSLDEVRLGATYASVTPVWPTNTMPVIVTTSLAPASLGDLYGAVLKASGGDPRQAWSISSGSLPDGFEFSSIGTISGLAAAPGTNTFTVEMTDGAAQTASQQLTLVVVPEPMVMGIALVAAAGAWRRK